MLGEILVGALVVVVAVLVAVDFSRTKSEAPHGHADGSVAEGRPVSTADTRGGPTEAFLAPGSGTGRRPDSGPPAAGPQPPPGLTAGHGGSRKLRDWPVRSRLLLLAAVPAVAVAVAAFCVVRLVDVLQGTPIHSGTSSVRDRALVSALVVVVVMVIVLALALWSAVVAARSILSPLYKLRAGALEKSGEGVPSVTAPIDVDSADEIGDIARAVNEMRTEVVRLAGHEDALQGKLDAMFVNLSHRSQSLVERQIRLIEDLEQGEQDRERRAHLFRMNRIASRMHRSSQNLLILAGHVPSSGWSQQPIALVNVVRAAVSEIEEYERISLAALPEIAVRGPAVNDVVHLLAELAENATSFSAADMLVDVSGHLMKSGGVLVDITDRGVGMAEKELAYANWRLENPPAADINVPKWMGLFVAARLAARHGIRIRLRQAEFGGLTALVWLPDDVLTPQGAATPRRGSHGGARPGSASHSSAALSRDETPVGAGHAFAGNQVTAVRSAEFAPSRDELRDASVGQRFTADTGRRPGPSATRPQPVARADAPTGVRLPGPVRGQQAPSAGMGSVGELFDTGPSPSLPASGAVIVPPVEDNPDSRGLPIFDSIESHWFSVSRETLSSSGPAAATATHWSSPADEGWHAAEAADSPSSGGSTGAGLPRRTPRTNLIPGAIPSPETVAPARSAAAARDRLAGLQRGVSEARAAAREAGTAGHDDGS
jgi:signal transduction histidine kinase